MTRRLPDLEAWAVFAAVAAKGSFAGAAAEFGLAKPTVSKAVARLEARLGVSLVNRTSRRLSLTEAGRAAVVRAERLLAEAEALEDETVEEAGMAQGVVRIAAPVSFGIAHLAGVLPEFLRANPGIRPDLSLSDRRVDLVADGFDLALRISAPEPSSLLCRPLCRVRLLPVASPDYLRRSRPVHPSQLAGHRVLAYGGSVVRAWHLRHRTDGGSTVEPPERMRSDNADVILPALLAGEGIALMPEFLVWRELREGRLERVLPDWFLWPLMLHLLMPPGARRPRRVRLLIDHLAKTLPAAPWNGTTTTG